MASQNVGSESTLNPATIVVLRSDPALAAFFRADTPAEVEIELEALLESARRFVLPVLRRHLRGEELDDVSSEPLLRIAGRLRAMSAGTSNQPIRRWESFCRSVARTVVSDHIGVMHPERQNLRRQVYYAMKKPGFATWRDERGRYVCGVAQWRAPGTAVPVTALLRCQQLLMDHRQLMAFDPERSQAENVAPVVAALLEFVQGPVGIDDAMSIILAIRGEAESVPLLETALQEPGEQEDSPIAEGMASEEPDPEEVLLQRERSQIIADHVPELFESIDRLEENEEAVMLAHAPGTLRQGDLPRGVHARTGEANGNAAALLLRHIPMDDVEEVIDAPGVELSSEWLQMPLSFQYLADRLGLKGAYAAYRVRARAEKKLGAYISQEHPELADAISDLVEGAIA